ncbi:MAG: hypothetical protein NTV86_18285 [Planctomycetota bacterium]|nr:hypothetical protein [Planctomycetota bacterium]
MLGATIGEVIECLAENPFGVVRTYLEDMDIDNERLLMQTAGEVTVLSDRADLYGKGLEITWSQSPQELTGLKIVHGIRADLYDMGRGEETMFGLPGGGPDKGGAAGVDGATTQPAAGEAIASAAPATRPAKAATTKPAKRTGKGVQIVRPRQNVYEVAFVGVEKDIHVVSGKQSLVGAKKLALQLEFTGGMRDGGTRRTPTSRPGPASKPGPGAPGETVAVGTSSRKAATRPATGPAGEKKPVTIEWDGALTLVPLARVEKPSEKRFKVEGSGDKVVLRDGDSSASCRKFSYHNDEEVAELNGSPTDPARLDIGNGQVVVCEQIIFRRKIGLAILPKAGYMARIRRPEVSKAQAARDREELVEVTGLSDPAEIKHLADSVVLPSDESADKPTVEDKITWGGSVLIKFKRMEQADAAKRALLEGKRFKEYIDEAYFKRDVQLVQGKYGDWMHCDDLVVKMGLSSKGNPQPLSSVAKAIEPGSRVTAWQHGSRRGAASKPADPADKDAAQRGTRIEADEIDVTFRERPRAATTQPADARMDFGGRSEPETMVAIGRVVVTDTARRDPKDVVRAIADRIESNVPLKSAILYGGNTRETFAKLTRGENDANVLAGAQLQVEDFDQRAIVKGPGFVTFMTDKDLNGRKVAAPRPVEVTWTEGMAYLPVGPDAPRPLPEDPKALAALKLSRARLVREAVFTGSVVMNTGEDTMSSHKMVVELDPPAEKPAKPATAPAVVNLVASPFDPPPLGGPVAPVAPAANAAAPAPDRGMLTVEDFGSRKLFMVSGEGDVVLRSLRREDAGFILRRLEARADKLLYYAGSKTAGNARIEVPGHGWLFNEDYRMEDQGGSAEGPSQTHFEWHKSMVLVQNADGTAAGGRTATLHGNVSMTHHSGRTIRVPKELMVRHSADKLPQGRITNLDCEDLIAEFEGAADKKVAAKAGAPPAVTPPDNKPADKMPAGVQDDAATGPAIGRLSLFAATGADADSGKGQREVPVQMTDGAVSIIGKRLLYNRQEHADQIATVYGYLLGKPDVNARVVIENPMEASVRTWESPKITILFDQTGKRIQQVKVEGGVGNQ